MGDASGPIIGRPGQFQIVPNYQTQMPSGLVPIDRVRILLERTNRAEPALDTVIRVSPKDSTMDLSLPVSILTAADTFTASIALVTQAGDTAFRGGPLQIVGNPRQAGVPLQAVIPIVYSGVGAHADSVVIVSQPSSVFSGDTASFKAVAYEKSVPVPGTPIAWISLDPVKAVVPKPAVGQVVANNQRGVARVVAQLINGPADTGSVTVNLPPAGIFPASGNLQIARVGAVLSPLVVLLKAADNVPVAGAWVRFSVLSGGGALSTDSVLSDASGKASVQWTLGSLAGPQIVRVTSPLSSGSQTLFNATAIPTAAAAIWTNATGGLWSIASNWSTGLLPGPLDTVIVNLAGSYTVNLDNNATVAALMLGAGTASQTLTLNGKTLTLSGTAQVTTGGVLNLSSAVISGIVSNLGTVNLFNSSVNGLQNRGLLVASGASTVGGTLLTFAGSTLRVQGTSGSGGPGNGDAELTVANGFTNNGVIELTDVGSATSATLTVTTGTLINSATGAISSLVGGGGTRTINSQLSNQGTVGLDQSLYLSRTGVTHDNTGTLDIRKGTLSVAATLALQTSSLVNIYVTSASQYTHLAVSGAASLGGELHLDFSAHSPTLLEQYSPVAYGTHTGNFGSSTGLGLGGLLLSLLAGITSLTVSFL
jgi:hypothetical protein